MSITRHNTGTGGAGEYYCNCGKETGECEHAAMKRLKFLCMFSGMSLLRILWIVRT
jgi:hypothetical protein